MFEKQVHLVSFSNKFKMAVLNWKLANVPGFPKKVYPGMIRCYFQTCEAITLQSCALDRGKSNLDFDMLQLYCT